jgi:transposase
MSWREQLEITSTHAAGLDVHKKTVVACIFTPGPKGKPQKEIRTFRTMTQDLLALAAWLTSKGVTHVAMESTGEFWKPVYQILEASCTVLVVNAQHIKTVPGRKTDVKDAEWIADLLRHGLLKGSCMPPLPQRDLRDRTRQRTNLVPERARVVNQLQKVLEWANLKLASVVSDIMGVSARAMLLAIVGGETDQAVLAALGQGRLRAPPAVLERALEGSVRDHHRFMLAKHLVHIDFLEEQIADFNAQIAAYIDAQTLPPPSASVTEAVPEGADAPAAAAVPWEEARTLLDTAPGIGPTVAEMIIAEIGTDMRKFPSEAHLASWAKLSPGNHESGGKRYSGKTGKGSRWVRTALVQAAGAAVKVKGSHLAAVYHRLQARRGKKKAIIAVAPRILVAIYHMLKHREPYREVGTVPTSEHAKRKQAERMQRRIEQLGYTVRLEPATSVPA